MKLLLPLIALVLALPAQTAQLSPAAKQEIPKLFQALKNSGCEFNRNGTWYSATRATEHLQKKYNYLLKRDLLTTTESFIDLAASTSSMTKRPYLVRCPGQPEIQSKPWFKSQLYKIRK